MGCWKYQLNSSKTKLSKGICFQRFLLIVGMFARAWFECLLGQVWEIPPENHRAGTVTHTVGWPMDLMSYGGVGLERTAANSFAPCQTPQPPAPRFVLPARWLHLPYGTQSSTHRPGMLYAMMIRWSWWALWLWWQNVSCQVWWLVLTTRTHMCRFDCKEIQGMPKCHMLLKNSNFFA